MVLTFLSLFCGLHDDGSITEERREKWGICMPATLCLESLHAKKPIALWERRRRTFLHIFADTEHEKKESNEDENVVLRIIRRRVDMEEGVGQPS